MNVIVARSLTKRYGRRLGADSVDLEVPEGSLFGFLGPNGAGKTTTIRLLLGFLRPDEGRATVCGHDCWRASRLVKREVGYVPGDLRLYSWMNGRSALRVLSRVRGRDLEPEGHRLAERYRFDPGVRVDAMSRGMRQKLGLILALVHRPRLAILDEPTSGLDPLMQAELGRHLRELVARGSTIFFSSHTLSEVEELCDRIAIVRDGRIVADESLESLRSRARRHVTIRFATALESRTEPPAFLDEVERTGEEWHADLVGAPKDLVRWAAERDLADLTLGKPDLERLFHRYYRDGSSPDEEPS